MTNITATKLHDKREKKKFKEKYATDNWVLYHVSTRNSEKKMTTFNIIERLSLNKQSQ